MSFEKELDQLEDQYFGEWEEDRESLLPQLSSLYKKAASAGRESALAFTHAVANRFSGVYIPELFWMELSRYTEKPENRSQLFDLVAAFSQSGFEEEEQKKMKSLLISYFAMEKEFELDKIQDLIISKAHPSVREYFRKITDFVRNNKNSVNMYVEKFHLLKGSDPDFELLKLPITKLKDKLEIA